MKLSPRKRKILKWVGIVIGVLFGILIVSMIVLAFQLPNPNRIMDRDMQLATQILDRNGELLYSIHGDENRTMVQIEDIPENVKNATIAIEDPNFYKHMGFSLKGILRAVFRNITGGTTQGGSTITQQFVKNSILTPEKTFTRKFKELVLSFEIELVFTKEQILQMYFNEIPYGSTAYGIKAASETFFGKELKDLTLAESAYLAGLPQAPSRYSPFINPEYGKQRQEHVLNVMAERGYINQEQADEAKTQELNFKQRITNIKAPHFVFYVRQILEEQYGTKKIEQGGLKVTTTLDVNMQKIAEEEVSKQAEKNKAFGFYNAALSAMNPKNGEVLAMAGSVDYFAGKQENGKLDGQVNVMTSYRQPGSSFKPIAYTKAFEKGIPPSTILFDVKTNFGGVSQDYIPSNFSKSFAGPIDIRHALQQSLNIPAIKAFYLAKPEDVATLANKLGYSNFEQGKDYGLATAIGAREVKGIEHLGAFATFANNGVNMGIKTILKIEDSSGKVLYEKEDEGTRVVDENAAKTITNVLSDNNSRTWGRTELTISDGRPVAAKTGTSNKNIGTSSLTNNTWTVGYTPSLAAVAWAGNSDGSVGNYRAESLYNASPIWKGFMERATASTEKEQFDAPKPIESSKSMLRGKMDEETKITICKPSKLIATENCPESMREEKTFREVHTILYYIDRDNPSGDSPKNPEKDPQFRKWEDAVKEWAKEKGYEEEAPTENDKDHEKDQWPEIEIKSPSDNAEVSSDSFSVTVNIDAPRKINRVVYYINGIEVGTSKKSPWGGNIKLPQGTGIGFQKLKALVFDDVENSASSEISINVKASNIPPSVSILNPQNGAEVAVGDSPFEISASTSSGSGIQKVTFYYRKESASNYTLLSTVTTESSEDIYKTDFTPPSDGSYFIYAIVKDNNGRTTNSSKVKLIVKP